MELAPYLEEPVVIIGVSAEVTPEDPEVVATPYPLTFGEATRWEEAAQAARRLRQGLRRAAGLTLADLYNPSTDVIRWR